MDSKESSGSKGQGPLLTERMQASLLALLCGGMAVILVLSHFVRGTRIAEPKNIGQVAIFLILTTYFLYKAVRSSVSEETEGAAAADRSSPEELVQDLETPAAPRPESPVKDAPPSAVRETEEKPVTETDAVT